MKKCERIFQFCLQTISGLAKEAPAMALRLFLQGALAADQVASETITYELISQVCVCLCVSTCACVRVFQYCMWLW